MVTSIFAGELEKDWKRGCVCVTGGRCNGLGWLGGVVWEDRVRVD